MQKGPKYTTIIHSARRSLNLSFIEYAVVEGIAHLSNQKKYPWCLISRQNLASFYGFSRRGIIDLIDRMIKKKLLEKNNKGHLRTSQKWLNATTDLINSTKSTPMQKVHSAESAPVQKVHHKSAESAHNHNNKHNKLIIEKICSGYKKDIAKNFNDNSEVNVNEKKTDLNLVAVPRSERCIKTAAPKLSLEKAAAEVISHFNKVYDKKFKLNAKGQVTNLSYWLDVYTIGEIKLAISNSLSNEFWGPIFKNRGNGLELLLRQRRPQDGGGSHQCVDRIGQLLNIKVVDEHIDEAKEILSYFDEVYGTQYATGALAIITRRDGAFDSLFVYWLGLYSVKEMKKAVDNSKYDSFWCKRLTPMEFFRKENRKGDSVDYINRFLNTKVPVQILPLTDSEFYVILKKLNVPANHVKKRYDQLTEMVEKGRFKNDDDDSTLGPAITRWVESDLTKGYTGYCNEIEKIDLENYEPKNLLGRRFTAKMKEYDSFVAEFKELKFSLKNAPVEEAEKNKIQLKEKALKGKEIQAEYFALKKQMLALKEKMNV